MNQKTVDLILRKQKEALGKTGLYLAGKLKKAVSVDTGQQANSITSTFMSDYKVQVGTNVSQAWIEEFGRKPGRFPNLDSLVGWAGRKGFHTGRKTAGYDALKSKDKGKVFVLARSIARKGIKAKETYTKTREKEIENMKRVFVKIAKL